MSNFSSCKHAPDARKVTLTRVKKTFKN